MAAKPTAVSLLSSATECIYALGLEAHLVGRSHECDYPPAVSGLPECSIALVDHRKNAASIDAQVKQLSDAGTPMYELNSGTVLGLAPDVIVVQDSCRICAVSPDALSCSTLDCKVVTLCPKTLPDVLANVVEVAEALGHKQRGLDFVEKMQHRLDRLPRPSSPPNVCVLEWIDPLMSCGYVHVSSVQACCENEYSANGHMQCHVHTQVLDPRNHRTWRRMLCPAHSCWSAYGLHHYLGDYDRQPPARLRGRLRLRRETLCPRDCLG